MDPTIWGVHLWGQSGPKPFSCQVGATPDATGRMEKFTELVGNLNGRLFRFQIL